LGRRWRRREDAWSSGHATGEVRLGVTSAGATVTRKDVAVVTRFTGIDHAVAAHASASSSAGWTAPARFDEAGGRATVEAPAIVIIALLPSVDDTVAAVHVEHARAARRRASPPDDNLAGGRATMLSVVGAVVALLATHHLYDLIAAIRVALTHPAVDRARV